MRLAVLLLLAVFATVRAHDGLEVEPPQSEAEAWNTVQLCAANVETLMAQQQWSELPVQLGIVAQATRFLREHSTGERAAKWTEFDALGLQLVRAVLQKQGDTAQALWVKMRMLRDDAEKLSGPKVARAAVYSCPMCRGVREFSADATCFKCGMKLVPRVIPASSLYNTPGEPSVVLTPRLDAPLVPGRAAQVTIKFARRKDVAPVLSDDLLIVHTERIHLLIVDESLSDYQHIHPAPAKVPGEYEFTITPTRPGPHRVFADIVPAASNVQEYAVCDLPGEAAHGDSLERAGLATSSAVEDLRFQIQWNTAGLALQPKQPVSASILVSTTDGRPFAQLEPLMGTYAHLVAFHEDRQTVLHIHPAGGADPQTPQDRGGPRFGFRWWAPKPGFYRLYVQVQAGGKQVFAPFALEVK
jgi:hypothetical protein